MPKIVIKTVGGMTINTEKFSVAKAFFEEGASVLYEDGSPVFTENTVFNSNGTFYDIPSDPALDNNCESCQ